MATPEQQEHDDYIFQILDHLEMQLERHYSSMREAFLKVDSDRSGWLSKEEFATIFAIYNISISPEDLDALIDAFDADGNGQISWVEFCETIENGPWYANQQARSAEEEVAGPTEDDMEIEDLEADEEPVQEAPKAAPKPPKSNPTAVKAILDNLRRAVNQCFNSLHEAFLHIDTDRSGYISAQEMVYILYTHNIRVEWPELRDLIAHFDTNGDGVISWAEFCQAIDKPYKAPSSAPAATPAPEPEPAATVVACPAQPKATSQTSSPDQLKRAHEALCKYIVESTQSMREAFVIVNTSRTGAITPSELEAAVRRAGVMRVADETIDALMDMYDTNGDGLIQFGEFVKGMSRSWVA